MSKEKKDLLSIIESYMTVTDPKANFSQYVKYRDAIAKVKQLIEMGKVIDCEITNPKDKLNWHTIKASIDFDTDLDGPEETKLFADFLSCFDYVVFEEAKGKIKLNCSVENLYV